MSLRLLFVLVLAIAAFTPDSASAQAGRGCSVFNQCPSGFSCMPFRQVCHRDSGAVAGEACQAGYGCARGFTCEAGTQVCRGPGREGDACHLTRPCGAGLTCEAGTQRCRAPGALGEACHATRPCGSGLSCQPGVHRCYHTPRKAGEPCSAGFGCGPGLYCQSFLQQCVASTVDYNSNSACGALRIQATAEDARRAGITMSFSAGSSGGAGAYVSYETGLVYGDQGQFGCFATACVGNQSDVSIGNFANFGIYDRYEDFVGFSAVTNQGVDTPFINLGFQTSQVFSARAPQRPSQILRNRVVGTTSGLTFGVGLSPVNVGSALCYTARLDQGDPLREFANIESLLTEWGQFGFAPERRPAALGGSSGGGTSPAPPVVTPPPGSGQNLEAACFSQVQGRVAWNRAGNRQWNDANVRRLCAGTRNPQATISCFTQGIAAHDDWNRAITDCAGGRGAAPTPPAPNPEAACFSQVQGRVAWNRAGNRQWNDANVRRLCAGTRDPQATISCFTQGIAAHDDWSRAINDCAGGRSVSRPAPTPAPTQEAACFSQVQGRVAWNRAGNRQWNDANVRRLCAGTRNPQATISCFTQGIAAHDTWSRAIQDCAGRF